MTAPIHQEIVFEDEICRHLQTHGWLFDGPLPYKKGFEYDAGYDRRNALFPADAIAWVKKTQVDAWNKFTAHHKDEAESEREFIRTLASELDRERKTIKKDDPLLWGSLHVLRRGFKHINASFKMATFAPANSLNPRLWDEYQKNILRVVRQVYYSRHNEKSIDLVLFLNGIPIATIELKTETTQSIEAAVRQYKKDRLPVDVESNTEEPLLSFGKRALVHFAVSSDEVRMTTKLDGDKSYFLPFNKGIDDGMGGASAGNPADHARGHATAYFWHEILEPKMILDIVGKFISVEVKEKANLKTSKKTFTSTLQQAVFKYVQLHPTSIGQKITIIVEHFRKHVMHMLNGQAKAMVVTDSRKAAVRYKKEFDKYMARMGYSDFKALVAYSGTITDEEYGILDADEGEMNGGTPKIKDDLIKQAFLTDEFRVLLVANKFQVGFDEPRLCAMYVDKRLDNVMAVQTLSRLNRIYPGKEVTCVIDFRNKAEDILAAFQPYYRTATLAGITDRNLPHHLREKLDGTHVYLWEEVEAFAKLYFSIRNDQAFQSHLKQALERFKDLKKEEQDLFRGDAQSYVTTYDFLSQLVDYDDVNLEKLHAFLKMLLPRLRGLSDDPVLLDNSIRLGQYKLFNKREAKLELNKGAAEELKQLGVGGGSVNEDPREKLSEIIKRIHKLFTGKHSDPEIEGWFTAIVGNTASDDRIITQAKANQSTEQFSNGDYRSVLAQAVIKALTSHKSMSEQMLQNPTVFDDVAQTLLPEIYARARSV